MSFPNPPAPDQEYPHPNGITYIYNADNKTWDIKYEQAMNTGSLPLINPSNRYSLPSAGASLPDSGGLITQSDYNTWAFNSLVKVDATSRVDEGEDPPDDADTNTLWYKPSTGSLYIYYNDGGSSQWVEISASDEVNLDGFATEAYVQDQIKDFATTQEVEDGDTSTFDQLTVDYQTADAVLHRQIVEVEEELEALMPSVERGEWDFSLDVDPGANGENQGIYSMRRVFTAADRDAAEEACTLTYLECMQANQNDVIAQGQCNQDYTLCSNAVPDAGSASTTDDFALTEVLRFATYDANNESHNWIINVAVGTYINVFNEDNDDYALYQVTDVQGMWYEGRSDVTVDVISAKGKATGRARFKVFTLDDDTNVDLTNYVQKSGDTMTGTLSLTGDGLKTHVKLQRAGVDEVLIQNHYDAIWLLAKTDFKLVGDINGVESQMLKVYKDDIGHDDPADDKPGGIRISNMRDPTSPGDGVSLGYMEDYVANHFSGFTGDYLRLDGGVMSGNLVMNGAGFYTDAIIKSNRTSGYAFQVHDESTDTNLAFIHSNGNIRGAQGTFTDDVEIRGDFITKGNNTLEGDLIFTGTGRISANSGSSALSDRVSLEIATAADKPIAISSGSTYKKVLAFYGYDGNEDDNRAETAYINANGNAYFSDVYSNGEKLATESYVPPVYRWKYTDKTQANTLDPGEFLIAGNENIYLHPETYDGIDLSVNSTATQVANMKHLGSILNNDGTFAYHVAWTGITYNNDVNNYMRITKSTIVKDNTCVVGEVYRFNFPGLTY